MIHLAVYKHGTLPNLLPCGRLPRPATRRFQRGRHDLWAGDGRHTQVLGCLREAQHVVQGQHHVALRELRGDSQGGKQQEIALKTPRTSFNRSANAMQMQCKCNAHA